MNKKIASEIAVGIILLLTIVIGGIFYLQNKKETPTPTVRSQQPVTNQPVVAQPAPATPVLGISTETINALSAKGYSNWKTYTIGTLQLDLPTFFDKNVVSEPEIFKIIQITPSADRFYNGSTYIGYIGGCEERHCQDIGKIVDIYKYAGTTPLDAIKKACESLKNDFENMNCAVNSFKKINNISGLESYATSNVPNNFVVGNGSESYFFSIGNSSDASTGEDNGLWKAIIETVRQAKPIENKQPTQLTDETANWQTYKNEEFGFELKMPNDWGARTDRLSGNSEEDPNMTDIALTANSKGENFDALWIVVTPIKDLKKCDKITLCNPGMEIGRKNDYFFGAITGTVQDVDYYNKYMNEKLQGGAIPKKVLETFKLTD